MLKSNASDLSLFFRRRGRFSASPEHDTDGDNYDNICIVCSRCGTRCLTRDVHRHDRATTHTDALNAVRLLRRSFCLLATDPVSAPDDPLDPVPELNPTGTNPPVISVSFSDACAEPQQITRQVTATSIANNCFFAINFRHSSKRMQGGLPLPLSLHIGPHSGIYCQRLVV